MEVSRPRGGGLVSFLSIVVVVVLVTVVMLSVFSVSGCGRSHKAVAGPGQPSSSAKTEQGGLTSSQEGSAGISKTPSIGPDFGEGGGNMAEGLETCTERPIRSFTDPRTGLTHDIVDGYVLISFKNPPVLPSPDPNYFDQERNLIDPVYGAPYPPMVGDPSIDAFIAAENLVVINEWKPIKGMEAKLPQDQSVEGAIVDWPSQYSQIINVVDPVGIRNPHSWPEDDPNDELFWNMWALNESAGYYHINIQNAWRHYYDGWPTEVVAVVDSGVQRSHADFDRKLTPHGVNVSMSLSLTSFAVGGGEPIPYLLEHNPHGVGHGTCVAGIIGAGVDNDGSGSPDDLDLCGVSCGNLVLPIAMIMERSWYWGYPDDVYINALIALGCVKRAFRPEMVFQDNRLVPYYNIEVLNLSLGGSYQLDLEYKALAYLSGFMNIIASAGNDGTDTSPGGFNWPAAYPYTIAVAAHDTIGRRACFGDGWTNWNLAYVDIAAPGIGVVCADMKGDNSHHAYLGYGEGYYASFSGTSCAAPHVAAVAAILSSSDRELRPQDIRSRILDNKALLNPSDPLFPAGRIDAYAALSGE